MTKEDFLKEVQEAICGDRQLNYGAPEDNFERIAQLWRIYLGLDIDSKDVAYMMILMKIARLMNNPEHYDSIIDIAGYAACAGVIAKKPLNKATLQLCHDCQDE